MIRTLAVLSALVLPPLVLNHTGARADDAPKPTSRLQGTWLFDEAVLNSWSHLGSAMDSVVTITGDSFTVSKLMGCKHDLKGKLVFDPKDPTAVDLKLDAFDLSEVIEDYKAQAGTARGRFKLDGDKLTLCLPHEFSGKRPADFTSAPNRYLAVLVRAPKDFKAFPKDLKVSVVGTDGKPVAGASVCQQLVWHTGLGRKAPTSWTPLHGVTCDADGTVVIPRDKLHFGALVGRDPAHDTIGTVRVTPAGRLAGEFRIELKPQVRVSGTLTCEELTKAGQPLGWAGGHLLHCGNPIGFHSSLDGKFEFLAPPGKYTLKLYGSEVGERFVDMTVPEDRTKVAVPPVELPALAFAVLKGKPAPEMIGVVGWKGEKTTLADLKGKYVLVEFWGYWCGPCVATMPSLVELHERFADKGLAIIGVHVDRDGEVDTSAKLDAKLEAVKKQLWKGKDLPFPVALVSGAGDHKRTGGLLERYGIQGYPTTILIDRDGKVVGQFHLKDGKEAVAEIEKLLAGKK